MDNTQTNPTVSPLRALILLPLALFVALLYTFLHEGGHALAGLLFGGRLTSFSVNFFNLSAHAATDGSYSTPQQAIITLAGIALPLILWAAWIALVPRRANPVLEILKLIVTMGVVNTLLAWMIIPILAAAGSGPVSDDSYNFMTITGIPPLMLAAAALLVYIGCWALFLARSGDWRTIIPRLRAGLSDDFQSSGAVRTLVAIGAISLLILLALAGLSRMVSASNASFVPEGYTPAFDLPLENSAYTAAPVYRFTLAEPGVVSLYFVLEDIQNGPLILALTGPGVDETFFQHPGEDVDIGRATVNPKDLPLSPGEYQVVITAPKNPGSLRLFVRAVPPGDPQ